MAFGSRFFGRLRARFRKEVCPFCFEYFHLKEAPFRCSSPPAICAPAPDSVLATKWNLTAPKGKVIPAAGYRREQNCPSCSNKTRKRICPHCHQDLPHTIGEFRNYIIAVIGAKGAGKSHYLPALIEQIKNGIGPNLGLLLEPLNDDTIKRYRRDFYGPVYTDHRTINVTMSAITSVDVRFPLVFSLLFTSGKRGGGRRINRAVTLAFFDTAGEDLHDPDVMAVVNKYIYRSDGIILLLDPLQLDGVRSRIPPSVPVPVKDHDTSDIIIRVSNLIRAGRFIPQDKPIDVPLAIAVSKIDAVETLLGSQSQIPPGSDHAGGFDLADTRAVDAEMQAHISDWNSRYLIDQVQVHFPRHAFFALSALGESPKGNTLAPVFPKRVEDPFLWLLHVNGLIKPKK